MAGASVVNSVVMRSNELQKGITLYDEIDHKPVGKSKRAAYSAVTQTAYTRMFLAFQTVFVPGMVIGIMNNRGMLPRNRVLRSVSEVSILAALLTIGLPASIAFFSQKGSMKAKYLEQEFKDKSLQNGKKPYVYFFNRGL